MIPPTKTYPIPNAVLVLGVTLSDRIMPTGKLQRAVSIGLRPGRVEEAGTEQEAWQFAGAAGPAIQIPNAAVLPPDLAGAADKFAAYLKAADELVEAVNAIKKIV